MVENGGDKVSCLEIKGIVGEICSIRKEKSEDEIEVRKDD